VFQGSYFRGYIDFFLVRQASLISGGRAEVAKPESELYERERGQTKKSKLAPSRRASTNICTRTLFLFPHSFLTGSGWLTGWGVVVAPGWCEKR
jgi:hypothetical protein